MELKNVGFGILSTQPFIGDPGIVLSRHLTELHRVSQWVFFLNAKSLLPSKSQEQQNRFQGMGPDKASLDNFEFCSMKAPENVTDPYLRFFYNLDQEPLENYQLVNDPFKHLTIIQHRFIPNFCSFCYWKTRVYGWVYGDRCFSL